jgi:hypothetical protein
MDIKALQPLCDRAKHLSSKLSDDKKRQRCLNMIDVLLNNIDWPDLKIGGWLEHIITVCIESGISSIEQEREFSRPIKHAYFKRLGVAIPKSIDVMAPLHNAKKNISGE